MDNNIHESLVQAHHFNDRTKKDLYNSRKSSPIDIFKKKFFILESSTACMNDIKNRTIEPQLGFNKSFDLENCVLSQYLEFLLNIFSNNYKMFRQLVQI